MKTKQINLIFACLLSSLFFISCNKDDDDSSNNNPNLDYENGFLVLNEGSSAGGSVTFVSEDLQKLQPHVFSTENPEESLGLGLFLQSIFFHEDRAYIISNGSNLITVVNRYTFELLGRVDSGLDVPRYGVVANGKAYVTNQASFQSTTDDFVAVIDLENLQVEETIPATGPMEFILEHNGKLYVQNAAYDIGGEISVINPVTNQVEERLTVINELNSIEIEGNYLYALSASAIKKVDLSTLEVSGVFAFLDDSILPSKLEIEDGKIYFVSGKKVYSTSLQSPEVPTEALLISDSSVIYGFEVENGRIFIADAGDFASDGFIYVYNEDGTFVKEMEVGVAPNGVYFNPTN